MVYVTRSIEEAMAPLGDRVMVRDLILGLGEMSKYVIVAIEVFFTGLRLAISIALMVMVTATFVGTQSGK